MLCFDLMYIMKKNEINKKIAEAYKDKDYKKAKQLLAELSVLESTHRFPKYMA